MSKIQRWFADDLSENYEKRDDGRWVKWEDVEALVKEVREECAVLAWAAGMSSYKGYNEDPREIGSRIAEILRKLNT